MNTQWNRCFPTDRPLEPGHHVLLLDCGVANDNIWNTNHHCRVAARHNWHVLCICFRRHHLQIRPLRRRQPRLARPRWVFQLVPGNHTTNARILCVNLVHQHPGSISQIDRMRRVSRRCTEEGSSKVVGWWRTRVCRALGRTVKIPDRVLWRPPCWFYNRPEWSMTTHCRKVVFVFAKKKQREPPGNITMKNN